LAARSKFIASSVPVFWNRCTAAAIDFKRQVGIPLYYKGELISEHRPDLIVADRIVVEIKSIARFDPIHTAVMLTYLRVAQLRLGLLLNFNTPYLRHGVRRVML
jgi:GxxExxY protein